ncbi:MAG: nitroreductase family protein [Planctomycetota bacterium]|jgi:nitroreductase
MCGFGDKLALMDISEAIKKRRSIRWFKQDDIPEEILSELIESARCAPSAANRQPLEYVIVRRDDLRARVFAQLAWAGYVQPRRDPPAGKRPAAYIIVLINKERALADFGPVDAAAAIENILLTAQGRGIGSCWLGSIKRDKIREILEIPDLYEIDSVIALGYPDEQPVMEDCKDESIEYYLDDKDVLHVPKRPVRSITHMNKFGVSVD